MHTRASTCRRKRSFGAPSLHLLRKTGALYDSVENQTFALSREWLRLTADSRPRSRTPLRR